MEMLLSPEKKGTRGVKKAPPRSGGSSFVRVADDIAEGAARCPERRVYGVWGAVQARWRWFGLSARKSVLSVDMTHVMSWKAATLFSALNGVVWAIAFWRTRRRLASSAKERQELEGSTRVLEQERQVLELIARGATLKQVLDALTQAVEKIVPGVLCSVLLVDRERGRLVQGAAPHLPPGFWKMCEGLPIVPDLGCCPTAAFRNETVICEDIASDFRWAPVRDQVLAFGLRSCWSVPIQDSETQRVIGTFAMYRNEVSHPTPFHLRAVHAGAQMAGNAIERLRAEQRLHDYAERFVLAEKVAVFGIWEWDPSTGLFDLGRRRSRWEEVMNTNSEEHFRTVRLAGSATVGRCN